jgi:heme a synthase
MSPSKVSYHPGLHRFAFFLAAFTPLLLLAGALVTSTGSSLAVPDWPLSFGKFFPKMEGGVLFEHGHRMIAGTVGFLTLGLALMTQWVEKRVWVKRLAWGALGAVVLQAVLGGVTVLLQLPTQVSVAHAGLAQIFFCLTISLALFTSRSWMEEKSARISSPWSLPRFALATTGVVYLQILVGAVVRHSGAGLAIPDFPFSFGRAIPAEWTAGILLQFLHTRVGATLVLGLVVFLSYRVCREYPEEKGLFWPAASAGFLVWLQCFLGMMILVTHKMVVPTSVHVVVGAGLLASLLILTLKSFQLFKRGARS